MPKFLQSRSVDSGTAFYFQNSSEKRGLKIKKSEKYTL